MPNVIESDDFNPKKIADDLFERCRKAKAWYVYCYIDESWTGSIKPFPFEMEIVDGVVGCVLSCDAVLLVVSLGSSRVCCRCGCPCWVCCFIDVGCIVTGKQIGRAHV